MKSKLTTWLESKDWRLLCWLGFHDDRLIGIGDHWRCRRCERTIKKESP